MGLDLGAKSIGIAITDPLRISVRPLTTLRRTNPASDVERIVELVLENSVTRVVAGEPKHLDGSRSALQDRIAPLAHEVSRRSGVPLAWSDERLSSKEADMMMLDAGLDRADRRRRRDEFAAALILRWYLEEQAQPSPPDPNQKARPH